MKVLFVCYGNMNRSQMAEAYYNNLTHTSDATSAGLDPLVPERYPNPPENTVTVMKEDGIDISQNKVKALTPEMITNADQIYVLAAKTDTPPELVDSPKVTFWETQDIFNAPLEECRRVRDEIKAKIMSIVNQPVG